MGYVSKIILIGESHSNDGGLIPYYLIEVWGDNIVFVCKQLRSSEARPESKLEELKVICKDPDEFSKDLIKAFKKVQRKSRLNKLGCSDIAIVSFDSYKMDKVFFSELEKEFPKHNLYFFPLSNFKIWNRWGNNWINEGICK
jgi:hypothetical protein